MHAGLLSSDENDFMGTQCDVACYGYEKPDVKCLGRFRERCCRSLGAGSDRASLETWPEALKYSDRRGSHDVGRHRDAVGGMK